MTRLTCTVRGCGRALVPAEATLRCAAGHAFDRSRHGTWNLLQPQDRRSRIAGDRPEALEARARWLERGFADGLVATIAQAAVLDELAAGAAVLDVGCGDGFFAERLFAARDVEFYGIDLALRAVRGAARRRLPGATWVVANADRGLPVATSSIDLALSIFGRRPAAELARVLRAGGRLVAVVPGDDDLAELRAASQGRSLPLSRADAVTRELAGAPFRLVRAATWRDRVRHDAAALADALAMTYRGVRRSERARLEERPLAGGLEVTLAAEVTVFERTP